MQLDAAIGATALLEWLHIDWVELLVVAVEPANDVSNRDDDNCKARWRALTFLDVEDMHSAQRSTGLNRLIGGAC